MATHEFATGYDSARTKRMADTIPSDCNVCGHWPGELSEGMKSLPAGTWITTRLCCDDSERRTIIVSLITSLGRGEVRVEAARWQYSRTRKSATITPVVYDRDRGEYVETGKPTRPVFLG